MMTVLALLTGLAVAIALIWAMQLDIRPFYRTHIEPEVQLLTDLQYWDAEFRELVGKDVREFLEPEQYASLIRAQAAMQNSYIVRGVSLQGLLGSGIGAPIRIGAPGQISALPYWNGTQSGLQNILDTERRYQ